MGETQLLERITLDRQDAQQPQDSALRDVLQTAHRALSSWAADKPQLASVCQRYGELAQGGTLRQLTGPTGERNSYALLPRERVLCLADNDEDRLPQLAFGGAVYIARKLFSNIIEITILHG